MDGPTLAPRLVTQGETRERETVQDRDERFGVPTQRIAHPARTSTAFASLTRRSFKPRSRHANCPGFGLLSSGLPGSAILGARRVRVNGAGAVAGMTFTLQNVIRNSRLLPVSALHPITLALQASLFLARQQRTYAGLDVPPGQHPLRFLLRRFSRYLG